MIIILGSNIENKNSSQFFRGIEDLNMDNGKNLVDYKVIGSSPKKGDWTLYLSES
jgi:hypothetical protein